jgi:dipeptidyl aminopeptidase/acylaminoacyl peptidase
MLAVVVVLAPVRQAHAVGVDAYVKRDSFTDIKISPNGDHFAATVVLEDRTALVVLRREDLKVTANFQLGKNTHVSSFKWVSPERVVIGTSEKFGLLDQPRLTGNLYAINADGTGAEILVGQYVQDAGLGTRIKPKKREPVAAFLVDDLPDDDKHVVVSIMPFNNDPYTRADKLDVNSGRRRQIARAPVRNASFYTDNEGIVRFAFGVDTDNARQLYYRSGEGVEWELLDHEAGDSPMAWPLGFSEDNTIAYLESESASGPNSIMAFDVASKTRKEVLRDDSVDPYRVIYRNGTQVPVGVMFMDGKPRTAFFDNASKEARLYRSLEAAFSGHAVWITSQSADDRMALVQVWNDRSPGDFYMFDTVAKKAGHLVSRRQWIDPDAMGEMQPVRFDARDGLAINGYLTVPKGANGEGMPLVVLPHGGPFGISDKWGFSVEPQILAAAGYAVLQVNYRGSGGYGRQFKEAGAKQWGLKMQDDLTDATRWAIKKGIANPDLICLYGASYGAYASLMGVAKEPGLYKCAAGYVGVYDLPMMQSDDARQSRRIGNLSQEWVGERAKLGAVSPNRMADRIKVPVFLAAGGEDEVAPIEHSEMMEKALRGAGVPVETLYYRTEGHGFYKEEHQREYYTKLLAFLAKHLGGSVAGSPSGSADVSE